MAAWHNGLSAGFWGYFLAVGVIAIGYTCLTLCISEMLSMIAFPGNVGLSNTQLPLTYSAQAAIMVTFDVASVPLQVFSLVCPV